MKKLLLSALFFTTGFTVAAENETTVVEQSSTEKPSIVFDFIIQPEEATEEWQQITEHAQSLIVRIKNMKENIQVKEDDIVEEVSELNATIFNVVDETLTLTNTIYELGKNSTDGSIVCNLYATTDNVNIDNPKQFPKNHLIIRLTITRTNSQNQEAWDKALAIANTFAQEMNNANDYDINMIKEHFNQLIDVVKTDDRISLTEGIHISLNADFDTEPEISNESETSNESKTDKADTTEA